MCRRAMAEMEVEEAVLDFTALTVERADNAESLLRAVQAVRRVCHKAARAQHMSRPAARVILPGLDVIHGGVARELEHRRQAAALLRGINRAQQKLRAAG